jgi:hypothetical protein
MEELELVSLKLTSGEEIIGKFVTHEGNALILKDARSIIAMTDGQLRLGPVLFSADKDHDVTILSTSIAVKSTHVRKEFADAYNQSISPLSIPKSKILLG